jgi:hypothetical protein
MKTIYGMFESKSTGSMGHGMGMGSVEVLGAEEFGWTRREQFPLFDSSKKDRNENLPTTSEKGESSEKVGNNHPTVKPLKLA